jgi:hypothetical protein
MTVRSASAAIPDRPCIDVVLRRDGSGTVNGRKIAINPGADARGTLMTEACRFAVTLGRPVRVRALDPDGVWHLAAHPDGTVSVLDPPSTSRSAGRSASNGSAGNGSSRSSSPPSPPEPASPPKPAPSGPASEPSTSEPEQAPGEDSATWAAAAVTRRSWYQPPEPVGTDRQRAGLVGATGNRQRPMSQALVISSTARTAKRKGRYARSIPLLGALIVGGLLLAVLVGVTFPRGGSGRARTSDQPATPTASAAAGMSAASPTPSASPLDPLPGSIAAPPGYQTTPVWAVPIAAWTKSVTTDDGTVLTRSPTGQLLLIDPRVGDVLWSSAGATVKEQTGPWLSSVDGAPVAAVVGPDRITYWTLPTGGTRQAGGPRTSEAVNVALPAGAVVSWAGPSPLVTLPGGGAAVFRSGALVPVTLPAGARGLAADGTDVLAVAGGTWLRQSPTAAPATGKPIPPPTGAKPGPLRVEAVGATFLLAVWDKAAGEGQQVSLLDTRTGTTVIQSALPAGLDLRKAVVIRELGGVQTALGPVVVDTYAARLQLLQADITVLSLTRGHAWVTVSGKATDIHLSATADFTTVPFGSGQPAMPIGISRAGPNGKPVATVVVSKNGGWVLAGLPSRE